MVKTYSLKQDGNTYLSQHFQVKEFACHNGDDKILIDTVLIDKLEQLRTLSKATSLVCYSGYRSPDYERKAGRSINGPHTIGCAADIKAYDKNKKLISAEILCCLAGDIGFNGIGYMNKSNLHVDTKSRKWWGDETVTTKYGISKINGSKDFYEYFNIKKVIPETIKKYIKLKSAVWCRKGPGFRNKRYKVIPKNTKCELLIKNVSKLNGYTWDKVLYNNEIVYLPNNWNLYL